MYVDILLLALLKNKPSHGYEIKKRVQETLGGAVMLNNNILYPALRRFEEMGAVKGDLVPQAGSPPRRVYRLTEDGKELLRGMLEDFPPKLAADDAEFLVRLAFFHVLGKEARLDILATRRGLLKGQADHLGQMLTRARQNVARHPFAPRLVEFQLGQKQREIEWIDELAEAVRKEAARKETVRKQARR